MNIIKLSVCCLNLNWEERQRQNIQKWNLNKSLRCGHFSNLKHLVSAVRAFQCFQLQPAGNHKRFVLGQANHIFFSVSVEQLLDDWIQVSLDGLEMKNTTTALRYSLYLPGEALWEERQGGIYICLNSKDTVNIAKLFSLESSTECLT